MADPIIRARLTLDTTGFSSGVSKAQGEASRLGRIGTTAAGTFSGIVGASAVAGVGLFFKGAVQGALQADQSATRLKTTMGNLGFGKQADDAEKFVRSMQSQVGVSKEQLIPAFEQLLRSTHDYGKARTATKLAEDVAAGTGRSLSQVSLALAKAYNGSTTSLQRLGIKVKDVIPDLGKIGAAQTLVRHSQEAYTLAVSKHGANSDQAKAAAERLIEAHQKLNGVQDATKNKTLDVDTVMKRLAATFGGQATKQIGTSAGQIRLAQVEFKQLQVDIGTAMLPVLTQLIEVFKSFLPVIKDVTGWIKQNPGLFKAFTTVLIAYLAVTKGVSIAHKIGTAASKLWTAAQTAATLAIKSARIAMVLFNIVLDANPIVLIVIAIAAFVAALILAYQHVGFVRTAIDAVWQAIQTAFGFIVDAAKTVVGFFVDHWQLLLTIITGPFGIAVALVVTYWDQIVGAVSAAVGFVWSIITTVFGAIVAFWTGAWNGLVTVVRFVWGLISGAVSAGIGLLVGIFNTVWGIFKAAWNDGWNGLTTIVHIVASVVKSVFSGIVGALKSIWNGIASIWNDTIGSIHIHQSIPIPGVPDLNFDGPKLPILKADTGAFIGADGLAFLHKGEVVVNPDQQAQAFASTLGGRSGPLVNIESANFGDAVDVDTFMARVAWQAARLGV